MKTDHMNVKTVWLFFLQNINETLWSKPLFNLAHKELLTCSDRICIIYTMVRSPPFTSQKIKQQEKNRIPCGRVLGALTISSYGRLQQGVVFGKTGACSVNYSWPGLAFRLEKKAKLFLLWRRRPEEKN